MKENSRTILGKIALGLALFAVVFGLLQLVATPVIQPETQIVNGFYALPQNNIQIAGVGSSEMMSGLRPRQLEQDYGWRVYDLGVATANLPVEYLYLQEVFATQSPSVVLVEVGPSDLTFDIDNAETMLYACSPIRSSRRKVQFLYELSGDWYKTLSYSVFPLLGYHASWDMFTFEQLTNRFAPVCNTEGGYDRKQGSDPLELRYEGRTDVQPQALSAQSVEYLDRMAALCQEQGAQLLLFKIPAQDWTDARSLGVRQYAQEAGLPFLDLSDHLEEIGLDPQSDFYDGPHLNDDGAQKVTTFMGKYLYEHYGEALDG